MAGRAALGTTVDLQDLGRLGGAAQPGHDRGGDIRATAPSSAPYLPLDRLGAVVVKSLAAGPWPGNPGPPPAPHGGRACSTRWACRARASRRGWRDELPALQAAGARVVASIWGRTTEEFERAADAAGRRGPGGRGGRGQRLLPEPGGPQPAVRPLARGDRRPRCVAAVGGRRPTPLGEAEPQHRPPRRGGRRRGRGRRRGGDAGQHRPRHGHRRRAAAPGPRRRRGRAVRTGDPPRGGAGRARRPRGPPRSAHRGRRRGGRRPGRGGAAAGRRPGRPGGYRHLRRSPRPAPGAGGARGLVRSRTASSGVVRADRRRRRPPPAASPSPAVLDTEGDP